MPDVDSSSAPRGHDGRGGADGPAAVATLETERLTLRPLGPDDLPALHRIHADPETMRFMPTPPHADEAATRDWLAQETGRSGARHWAIVPRGEAEPVGLVDYLGETRVPGMGYIVARERWGEGIATEACAAALDHGFDTLGLDRVELWIDERNAASRRVAEKLGFLPKGRLPLKYRHRAEQHVMLVYGQLAAERRVEPGPPERPRVFWAQPVLLVRDVARSVAFYRDMLGFHVDFLYGDPPEHAGISRGQWTGEMAVLQLSLAPPERAIVPSAYLYILVDHRIDELHATWRARGVELLDEPADRTWGMREFGLRDPDGHVLRIATHA